MQLGKEGAKHPQVNLRDLGLAAKPTSCERVELAQVLGVSAKGVRRGVALVVQGINEPVDLVAHASCYDRIGDTRSLEAAFDERGKGKERPFGEGAATQPLVPDGLGQVRK